MRCLSTWALHTGLDLDGIEPHLPALQASGLLGLVEGDGGVSANACSANGGVSATACSANGGVTVYLPARLAGLPVEGTWVEVPDRDWGEAWKAGLDAVTVGALTIVPPWVEHSADAIVIEPGQAFGTGHHETTTGCVAALQELRLTGCRVLDVGTGSGVLAICAARLGAVRVVAVDTDPLAVEAAETNAKVNGVAVDVRLGSVEAAEGAFEVVVANLDTSTVAALATELVARVAPGGTLVVSGVSRERQAEAVTALTAAGLPVLVRAGREWVVLLGRRR